MPRWLRRLSFTIAGIVALLVVVDGGLLLLLQTAPAKRLVAERLETELASATGFGVDIGAVDGFLPFSATISGIRLSDTRGPWLTADRLELEWRPAALFAGRLHVLRIVAGDVAIASAPVLPNGPDEEEPGIDLAIGLPRLPLPTAIDEVRIERLALAPDVLGTAAVLRVAGQASLGKTARGAAIALDVTRLDGAGRARLQLARSGSPASLTLAADIDEPQGGLIARALNLPGRPPISLRLSGGGPSTAWRGKLEAGAGPTRVDADIALAMDETLALSVEGRGREVGRLAPASAAYVPPSVDVATSLRWQPGRRLDLERLSLTASDASAELSGGFDFAGGRVQASFDLAVRDATRWRTLLAPASVRSGHIAGTIAGTLDEPTFALQTRIDGAAAPRFAADRTEAKLLGRATLLDRHIVTAVSVAAEGRSSGMVVDIEPQLAALLGDSADWSARATFDLLSDDIEISQARVSTRGSTAKAAGAIGGYGRAIDVTVQAELADIAPVARLLELPGAGSASVTARLSGDALEPHLTADLSGRLADFTVDNPALTALLGPAPAFSGAIVATSRTIDIDSAAIDGAGARVTAGGRLAVDGTALQLNMAATLPEIAPVATSLGVTARGRLAGRLQLTRTPEQPQLHFAATAESEGLVIDEATSALLGPTVTASAEGSLGPAGATLDAARIEGAAAQLVASGRIGDALALDYRLELPRLAALSPLAGTELAGSLTVAGDVTGPSASPAVTGTLTGNSLRVADIGIASAEGKLRARDLRSRPLGDVALHLVAREQRLSLATSYEVREDGAVALNDLRLAAPEASLAGNLVLSPTGLVDGRVGGAIDDLAPIGSFFGQSIAGAGTIALTFAPAEHGQAIGADLDLRDLSLSRPGSAPLSAAEIGLTADVRDGFGVPDGEAELRIANAASGALRLTQSTIAVDGSAKAMTIRLNAAGEHGRPLVVEAAGEMAVAGATQRLRLTSLVASFGTLQARLNAPATLSREGDSMALADLDATVGDGRLTGAGRLGARQVDLQLSLADLPLGIVSAFAPRVDLGGAASAELRLAGDPAAPAGHADIRLTDLRVGGTRIGDTVGLDGTAMVDLRDGRGSVAVKFGGRADFALDGHVTAPLAFGLQPFALELAETAPVAGRIDGRVDLALVSQVVDLHGDKVGGRLDLDMTIDGTLAAPRLTGEARIAEGSYAGAAGGAVVRNVAAVVTGDNDRIVLRALTASDGGEGRLFASGSATLGFVEGARYDGEVTLTGFAIPNAGGTATTASGHIAGTLQFAGTDNAGRRRFAATTDASGLAINGRGAGIFGPQMQARLKGALGDSGIMIETARIEGADGRFTADGQIAESIDLDYRLELSRLAALSPLAGIELDGSADIAGKISGPTGSPNLSATLSGRALRIADVVLAGAEGTISGRDLGGNPRGDIDLAVTAQGRQLSVATPYRLGEDGAIAFNGLRLTALQTALAGDLVMSPDGLLQGRFGGKIGDLALLDPFIDRSIAGAATLDLSFLPAKRTQAVKADVDIRNVSLAAVDGAPLTAERLTLTADLGDVLGTLTGLAELRIENAASGALSLSRATLTVDGAGKAMQVRLGAAGKHGQPFDVDAAGELALAPAAQSLRLDRLDARFGPIDTSLNAPATLSRDGRTTTLADLDATIGKGRITGSGSLGRSEVALQLALADLPLGIVSAFAPQMDVAGTASADLRLGGTPAAPTAHGEVRLKGVRSGGTKIGESVALDGTVTFDLQDGRGSMTAKTGGPTGFALDGDVALPVAFRVHPFALTVTPDAPLSGKVAGQVDLGLVARIVDLHGDTLDGRLTLDMAIAGTRAEPRLIGDARLADGSYASAEAGTTLRNIEATLSGDNERVVLRSLTATDGGQGKLSASGSAALSGAGAPRYDGEATLERFTILNRSDAVATASGHLRLEPAQQRPQLAGDVTVESAELRIPESLPPEIVKIDVVEINVPPGRKSAAAEPVRETMVPPLGLAVTVRIPGRAFLRGRGLDSEWRGKLRVAGTTSAPDITGRLEVVRGGLDLLGTQFEVESGTVTFIGGDEIDPALDFAAAAEANDINARVRVTGFASAPKFEIGSDSGLPPEEALSRLLFGQSAGSLSPGQAVQLAQAAATLSGGGPGVLDKLRSSIGLDVLSIESGGASPSDTSLKAGKYISDKVFLKVEQGVTAESREVGVEVRVLPRVTVEGGVGQEGSGRVGINWRYDY